VVRDLESLRACRGFAASLQRNGLLSVSFALSWTAKTKSTRCSTLLQSFARARRAFGENSFAIRYRASPSQSLTRGFDNFRIAKNFDRAAGNARHRSTRRIFIR
jgi:hypothetical protein